MFGIHLGGKHEKVIAVADIGSGSAAVALLARGDDNRMRILGAERRVLPYEERASEATVAGIGKQLVEAGQHVLERHKTKNGALPSAVYAVIRAPWARSKTVRTRSKFEQETRITGDMIGGLAHQGLGEDTELDHNNILEASVIRVELNGYPTNQPEGKAAYDLSVAALISDCDPGMRSTLTSSLSQLFGAPTPLMRSGTHALLSVLRGRPGEPRNYLIVDMASEGTNLIVMRDGITADHAFIAEGKHSILKRITGSGMPEDTLSKLRMIARGDCNDPTCASISEAMGKAEPELVRVFGETMGKLVTRERLPNDLILATHGDLIPWLSTFFTRIDFTQFTTTTQPFQVDALEPADFAHWALPEAGVDVDTGLSIASALVNIEESRA
ncbi:hypothetical protein A2763_01495 [Candidatus Kaiserbacteria bacterium RIFCSPHIGHO2_01_FULL_54_36]|uniref:SHS2 domain-containing protein n=1 Tax=Candidatus Kaiserbacteria bacterium RIFCSPHIGHO2_01_FULL_54_36 TaxID=1798482 RepID=A0A1F6CLA5_9BACT|nr:MAG: hypothetical protein A2763_01495 [Candidatus Kaiserbacteria bacterium RIFCSPHIGHO2_01_FULL_54_36]OGG75452.1 MAG: hypothetical protein A3A41_01095 [Candidatus Kaiserbacteria bacterium RIFCSPLOWO2_01_FULL_54_22]